MSARSVVLRDLAWLCAVAVTTLVCSSPALGARGHVFAGAFGEKGSGNGQFVEPDGVAVNEASGDIYVVDKGNNRVEYFSSTDTYLGQFNGSGLFVNEGKAVGSGGLPGEMETGQFSEPEEIAVDNSTNPEDPSAGDVYVVDAGHSVIDKFGPTGSYIGQLTGICAPTEICPPASVAPFTRIFGVSVDPKGELWIYYGEKEVANFTDALVNQVIKRRGPLGGFGFANPGFAVDSKDNLFVHINGLFSETDLIYKYDDEGQPLDGGTPSDLEPPTGVAVDLSNNDLYIDNTGTTNVFDSSGTLLERIGSGHQTRGSGVGINSTAEIIYVADSSSDIVSVFTPEPPSKPTVEAESVSDVTGNSATFSGELNPRGATIEYYFEYGGCAAPEDCTTSVYEKREPISGASLGASFAISSVSLHLQDLEPHTTYHFRLVAHNEFGIASGDDKTFTTQAAGGFSLSDGREWEMVSPPQKQGALLQSLGRVFGPVQAAADGSALAYLADIPIELDPQGNTSNQNQVFSGRDSHGWQSQDISLPHLAATSQSVGAAGEYRLFSEDLSQVVVQPFGEFIPASSPLALAPGEASEQTPFLRTDYLGGDPEELCMPTGMHCYRPLVIGCPSAGQACASGVEAHANVPAGTVFGEGGNAIQEGRPCPRQLICGPRFVGATPDLSHLVLRSSVPLTSIAPLSGEETGLYEWAAGKLQLVSVLPEAEGGGPSEGLFGFNTGARHAISNDGSRVFWSNGGRLYMREVETGKTLRLDAGSETGPPDAKFETASSSGSSALFLDEQQLTGDAGAQSGEADLYECKIRGEGSPSCELSDLTPPLHAGEHADVQSVIGASEDGSEVYFVANGILAPGAQSGGCSGLTTPNATCNLYVRHGSTTTLVAVLSGEDVGDWGTTGPSAQVLSRMTARVSPDGQWLAFMSQRSLTGYDNRDDVSGKPDEEVYLYDSTTGKLVCASCDPTGARPGGVEYKDAEAGIAGGEGELKSTTWLAADIPGWEAEVGFGDSRYQPRYLSDSGRLFFNSSDALVSQDVNGTEDVYEYEPQGVGPQVAPCGPGSQSGSEVFMPAHAFEMEGVNGEESAGCVSLISSGNSAQESAFLDASETGGDVFFLTTAKLVPQDFDTALDVYDAHECSTVEPCFPASAVESPPCTTEASCRAAPTPQPSIFGSPSSATFSGAGNAVQTKAVKSAVKSLTRTQRLSNALKACRRKPKERRAACKKQARRAYGPSRQANKSRKGAK